MDLLVAKTKIGRVLYRGPSRLVSNVAALDNLNFWLHSVHVNAKNAPIIVACTKLDLVGDDEAEAQVARLKKKMKGIQACITFA